MKAHYLIIIIVLLFAVVSCKRKVEPYDETSNPVFYAKGLIANEAINMEAGINSFYLQTDYVVDGNNVNEFSGNFKQTCASCKRSLKIVIKDYQQAKGDPFSADSSLMAKRYQYNLSGFSGVPFYSVKFTATPDGVGALSTHLWEFSDGSISSNATLSKTFLTCTDQVIKYTCTYANTCSSTLSYHVKFNPFKIASDLPDFNSVKIDSAQIIYQFTALGDDKNIYLWNMGNGKQIKGKTIFYGFDGNGIFTISLTQITANDTSEVSKNISVGNVADCKANFSKELIPYEDPLNLSTVYVEWTNEAGELYTSAGVKQSFYSQFSLLESSGYKTNSAGQATRLLKLLINCKLSNGSNTIDLKNLEVKMAVAHP